MATRSTVLVTGSACGTTTVGAGVVIGRHLVITSAHVIACMQDTIVRSGTGDHQVAADDDASPTVVVPHAEPVTSTVERVAMAIAGSEQGAIGRGESVGGFRLPADEEAHTVALRVSPAREHGTQWGDDGVDASHDGRTLNLAHHAIFEPAAVSS